MELEEIDLEIEPGFSLELFSVSEKEAEQARKKAVAAKTRNRIQARRANSEATLAEILPAEIEEGDTWHIMSQGDIDAMSYLAHLIKHSNMQYVAFSTWCMAMPDVEQIGDWLKTGRIDRVDAYVGEIFPNQYSEEHEALCATVRQHGGRVAVFKNHSKLFICQAKDGRAWVVESSANINTNPRAEQTAITADLKLFDFYKTYLDGIRSFSRDFDDWTPHHG